jgi:hypothetical protein
MNRLHLLPAVQAKRYGWIKIEFCVFNPLTTFAALAVFASHQLIKRLIDLA